MIALCAKPELGARELDGLTPTALRDRWLHIVRAEMAKIRAAQEEYHSPDDNTYLKRFVASISENGPHPGGGDSLAATSAMVSASGSEDDSSVDSSSSSSSDDPKGKSSSARKAKQRKPLVIDERTKTQLKLLAKNTDVSELQDRTVDWIEDTFLNGAEHVRNIVSGPCNYI